MGIISFFSFFFFFFFFFFFLLLLLLVLLLFIYHFLTILETYKILIYPFSLSHEKI